MALYIQLLNTEPHILINPIVCIINSIYLLLFPGGLLGFSIFFSLLPLLLPLPQDGLAGIVLELPIILP